MSEYDYNMPDEESIGRVRKLIENDENNSYLKLVLESSQKLHICLNCELKFYARYEDFHPNLSYPVCGSKLVYFAR